MNDREKTEVIEFKRLFLNRIGTFQKCSGSRTEILTEIKQRFNETFKTENESFKAELRRIENSKTLGTAELRGIIFEIKDRVMQLIKAMEVKG